MAAEGSPGLPGSGPAGVVQSPVGQGVEGAEGVGPGCCNGLSPAPLPAGAPQHPGIPRQCDLPCGPLDHDPQHSAGTGGVCVQVRGPGVLGDRARTHQEEPWTRSRSLGLWPQAYRALAR